MDPLLHCLLHSWQSFWTLHVAKKLQQSPPKQVERSRPAEVIRKTAILGSQQRCGRRHACSRASAKETQFVSPRRTVAAEWRPNQDANFCQPGLTLQAAPFRMRGTLHFAPSHAPISRAAAAPADNRWGESGGAKQRAERAPALAQYRRQASPHQFSLAEPSRVTRSK